MDHAYREPSRLGQFGPPGGRAAQGIQNDPSSPGTGPRYFPNHPLTLTRSPSRGGFNAFTALLEGEKPSSMCVCVMIEGPEVYPRPFFHF